MTDSRVWDALERWRSVAFLAGGVSFVAIAINNAFIAMANTGVNLTPLVHLGLMLLVYAGLLGLTSRLVERVPRLGRVCQVLPLVFGLEIVLTFVAFAAGLLPGVIPRFVFALIVLTSMIGAALTPTVFGAATLWSDAYSRAVGGFLLLAAVALSIAIVNTILFGDIGGPEWVSVVANGTFGLSLGAVGVLLRTEVGPSEQAESTETVV